MSRMDEAIAFAAWAHRGQTRKGTDLPYISHPYGVAMLLQQAGCHEDLVIAGLLHDTLEDTPVSAEEIKERFGDQVLRLVVGATEPDKTDSWENRKQHTLSFLKHADLDIRMLVCADKLHNLRSIRSELEQLGTQVWEKFSRGYEKQKWYFIGLAESLGQASTFPMLRDFRREIGLIFLKDQTSM